MKKNLWILFIFFVTYNISFADNLKIIDGDTIILNGKKVRFLGIDAPEIKQTCIQNDQKVECGVFAKMLLVKKIGNDIPKCISEGKDVYKYTQFYLKEPITYVIFPLIGAYMIITISLIVLPVL